MKCHIQIIDDKTGKKVSRGPFSEKYIDLMLKNMLPPGNGCRVAIIKEK